MRGATIADMGPLNPNLAPGAVVRGRDAFRWFAFLGILVCFWAIVEHQFSASLIVAEATGHEFDGTENRTADRLEAVNRGSSSARIALALMGLTALVVPSQFTFRWQSPVFWSIAAYVGWLFCTSLWSISLGLTIHKLAVVALFFSAALGISRHLTLTELVRMLAGGCLLLMLVGVFAEIVLGTFQPFGAYRFTGTTHPNTESTYASIVCLSASCMVHSGKRWKWLPPVAFFIGFVLLVLTKSRTSLGAMIVGLIAMQTLRLRGGQRLLFVASMLLLIGGGAAVSTFVGSQFRSQVGSAAAMGRTEDVGSLTGRVPLWEELLHEVKKAPWLGHGYLAYWDADRVEYLSDLFAWEIPHGHNMYVDVLLDGGMIGLVLYLTIYLTGLVVSARYYLRTGEPGAAIVFGILVFVMIHGSAESLFKMFGFSTFVLMSLLLRFAWIDTARVDVPRERSPAPQPPWWIRNGDPEEALATRP